MTERPSLFGPIKRKGKYWRVIDRMRADGTAVNERLGVHRSIVRAAA